MASIEHAEAAAQGFRAASGAAEAGALANKDAASTQSLADLFLLVSALLALPSKSLLEAVKSGAVAADADAMLRELGVGEDTRDAVVTCWAAEQAAADDVAAAISRVRQEYTRLFTSPEHRVMNIYEAAFRFSLEDAGLTGTFMGSLAARDAKRHYREAGVELTVMDSADHMGIECEFLGTCLQQMATSPVGERAAFAPDANVWFERMCAFEQEHADRWFADFFECLARETSQDFYRAVAALGMAATEHLKAFSQVA